MSRFSPPLLHAAVAAVLLFLFAAGNAPAVDLGKSLTPEAEREKAVRIITRAIESGMLGQAELALAHYNRGLFHQLLGQAGHAVEDYRKACLLDPMFPPPHNNLAVILDASGRSEQAAAELSTALALKPDYAAALNNRAVVYARLGEWETARNDMQSAARLIHDDPDVINNLAIIENAPIGVDMSQLRRMLSPKFKTRPASAPKAAVPPAGTPDAAPRPASSKVVENIEGGARYIHTVAKGDTLGAVARDYDVSVAAVRRANPDLDPDRLSPGQKIAIPGKTAAGVRTPHPAALPEPPPVSGVGPTKQHTVARGQTLSGLASHYGVALEAVLAANPGLDPDHIAAGQVLSIPAGPDGAATRIIPLATENPAAKAPLVTDFE